MILMRLKSCLSSVQRKAGIIMRSMMLNSGIMGMEKDAVLCWLAVWADSPSDAWGFKNDVRTGIITEFRRKNIEIHSISSRVSFISEGKEHSVSDAEVNIRSNTDFK